MTHSGRPTAAEMLRRLFPLCFLATPHKDTTDD